MPVPIATGSQARMVNIRIVGSNPVWCPLFSVLRCTV